MVSGSSGRPRHPGAGWRDTGGGGRSWSCYGEVGSLGSDVVPLRSRQRCPGHSSRRGGQLSGTWLWNPKGQQWQRALTHRGLVSRGGGRPARPLPRAGGHPGTWCILSPWAGVNTRGPCYFVQSLLSVPEGSVAACVSGVGLEAMSPRAH